MFNWRTVAWSGVVMPIFSFIAIALAPESPNWLARKGYYERAKKGKIIITHTHTYNVNDFFYTIQRYNGFAIPMRQRKLN